MNQNIVRPTALVLAFSLATAPTLSAQQPAPPPATPRQQTPAPPGAPAADQSQSLDTTQSFNAVGLESLDDLRSLVIEGPRDQVEAMLKVIEEIDRLSAGNEPGIAVVRLEHADAEAVSKLLVRIYESRDAARVGQTTTTPPGKVGFIPMAQPNAVVVVAQRTEIEEIARFVEELDRESSVSGMQFRVFPLADAPALQVQNKLTTFFAQRDDAAGMRVRVDVVADERTNSVMVFAGPNDMEQAAQLIQQLDGDKSSAVSDLKIFKLKNALAIDLANLINQAIVYPRQSSTGAGAGGLGQQGGFQGQQQGGQQQGGQQQRGGGGQAQQFQGGMGGQAGQMGLLKSSKLRFLATDANGKPIESGILEDVTVTADERTNSLLVTAPPTSMGLVSELIEQLDALPGPASELKVFTLTNADATAMLETLQSVFLGQSSTQGGQQGIGGAGVQPPSVTFSLGGQEAELSLTPLSFAVDLRTNSIIVSGTQNDLLAVEALLLKLDSNNMRERRTIVYRLLNLTADDAAAALEQFVLMQSSQGQTANQDGLLTVQEQIANEVSIVPEPVSNSLLISSTPRFFEEVLRIVQEIDMRPPQVVIQVLIAEVQLNDDEDFGLELGGQSSVLFDRSLQVRNTAINAQQNSLNPGYNFNTTDPLQSPAGSAASEVGLQSLTNFALGRAGSAGFGGLLLAASSDNVSILLRALKRQQRLDVLSRPQIMTLDNQQAFIQIGQQVPTVSNSQVTPQGGVVNSVEFRDIGILLQVTPRISPDGVVVMRVDPTVSSLAPAGIPISSGGAGAVIEAPIINTTRAQTTISAADGQTVVIGGLIAKEKSIDERKIPWVGDLPVVGWAFKTRFSSCIKRELLIILTPHIVYNQYDAQRIKEEEARRIDWIMKDVLWAHGDVGLPPDDTKTNGALGCDSCGHKGCKKCQKKKGQLSVSPEVSETIMPSDDLAAPTTEPGSPAAPAQPAPPRAAPVFPGLPVRPAPIQPSSPDSPDGSAKRTRSASGSTVITQNRSTPAGKTPIVVQSAGSEKGAGPASQSTHVDDQVKKASATKPVVIHERDWSPLAASRAKDGAEPEPLPPVIVAAPIERETNPDTESKPAKRGWLPRLLPGSNKKAK